MIPTIVPSSLPSTASSSSSSSSNNNLQQHQPQQMTTPQNSSTAMIGIAALILEGRAIAEDEYHQPQTATGAASTVASVKRVPAAALDSLTSGTGVGIGAGATGYNSGSSSFSTGGVAAAGRQSPKPSTSRAAFGSASSSSSGHIINITTNPHAFSAVGGSGASDAATTAPLFNDHYNSPSVLASGGSPSSSPSSSAASAESMHMRWTQKLCALRQVSPTASISTTYKQKIAVEAQSSTASGGGGGGEPELVALAINDAGPERGNNGGGGDFEIVRRVILQRHANMGGSAAASTTASSTTSTLGGSAVVVGGTGGSTDKFLHSLQSLATTCLRGSSPSSAPLSPQIATANTATQASTPKYNVYRATTPTLPLSRFQSPAYTSMDLSSSSGSGGAGSASSSGSGIQSPRAWSPASGNNIGTTPTSASSSSSSSQHHQNKKILHQNSSRSIPLPATVTNANAAAAAASNVTTIPNASPMGAAAATAVVAAPSQSTTKTTATVAAPTPPPTSTRYPQQGPHCDQFLRKMGLAKGESADAEDHFCDMSYVNITCSRWRAYCLKMEAIIERSIPLVIEVYLGPVGHKILLEQWIITQKEKVPPPTMTLPSLCSAIRSQLYFSQISAWCDLIKKSDKTIYETGRVIFPTSTATAAGDLATTSATSSSTNSSSTMTPSPLTSPSQAVTSSSSTSSSLTSTPLNHQQLTNAAMLNNRRPRLNIFYRIKKYDSTACFNSKPNVHNFPNVNITENCSISVCLKSLPRINGGIPNLSSSSSGVGTAAGLPAAGAVPTTAAAMPTTSDGDGNVSDAHAANGSAATTAVSNGAGALSTIRTVSPNPADINNASSETPRSSRSLTATTLPAAASSLNCDNSNRKKSHVPLNDYAPLSPLIVHSAATPTAADVITTLSAAAKNATTAGVVVGANSALGKHPKCMFFIDEEELEEAEAADIWKNVASAAVENEEEDDNDDDDEDDDDESASDQAQGAGGDSSNSSFSSANANLSHRERQLMKYRKRMQKRDKKRIAGGGVGTGASYSKPLSTASDASCELSTAELVAYHQPTAMMRSQRTLSNGEQSCCSGRGQPMEQGEEEDDDGQDATTTAAINTTTSVKRIKMISTGTQTPSTSCLHCGSVKTLICLKCSSSNNGHCLNSTATSGGVAVKLDQDEMDDSSTSSSISSSDIIHTPRNNAELLLQAIQRTPKAAKKHKKQTLRAAAAACNSAGSAQQFQNNNHLDAITSAAMMNNVSEGFNCQVCKRQKTQHNFSAAAAARRSHGNESTTASASSGVDDSADALASAVEFSVEGDDQADNDDTDEAAGKNNLYHYINNNNNNGNSSGHQHSDNIDDGYECMMYYHQHHHQLAIQPPAECAAVQRMDEQESYLTSTKLTPHIERCSLSGSSSNINVRGASGDYYQQQRIRQSCTSAVDTASASSAVCGAHFKMPTNMPIQQQQQQQTAASPFHHYQQTPPKPNLLLLTPASSGSYHSSRGAAGDGQHAISNGSSLSASPPALMYETITPTCSTSRSIAVSNGDANNPLFLMRKALPKVNLTPLFCSSNPAGMHEISSNTRGRLSAPIPIHNSRSAPNTSVVDSTTKTFSFEPSSLTAAAAVIDNSTGCIPVQKSYSAPTLPNSPSLSPRFAKQAAIYKRRSRHLSDRSDRSSFGSDELLSDEDLENGGGGMYSGAGGNSPATSPLKQRTRNAAAFGRLPLIGNLEESLLQRRLLPKIEVFGFKVLLGASGGFCPTQLTIPAAAYFYELHGETLSTPYVCDIRMPRKGYSVPRSGTVQATLLNPMGTVVRMFVVPYDMRDMPPLHQTFIRQRILAEASINETATLQNGGGREDKMNGFGVGGGGGSSTYNKYRLSPSGGLHGESNLGHFISAEHMKRLRYSIHLRFQTSRSGRLVLHTDIRLLISRRTDCDTAAAHAKGVLEAPNDLVTDTVTPTNPKYSSRQEPPSRI